MDPIKISQLPPIGNTIPGNTLVPVVNMTGTPDTQKATVANIANAILSQAGNLYISAGQANVANFAGQAGSVSNAMQPNITSVGILSNLTVEGLVNLGNVGNLVIYGGSNNQVLTTDGNGVIFWDEGGTYGNSEVANYLPIFTGNVGANWVIADYFMGNAHNLYWIPQGNLVGVDGNSSNVLYGNGIFASAGAGPSGISGYSGVSGFSGIDGSSGISGFSGDSGTSGFSGTDGASGISGYSGAAGVATLPFANGNSNFDIAVADGNVTITANSSYIWTFDTTGNLSLPNGGSLYSLSSTPSGAPGNTVVLQPSGSGVTTDQKLMVYPTAGDGDHIHVVTGNLYQTELFLGSDNFYVKLSNTGNVVINTFDNFSSTATWTFGTDGNLSLPSGYTFIKSQPNGYVGLAVIDDGVDQPAQLLSINATSGTGTTAISTYANNALIQANINGSIQTWNFDNTGNLTLPGNTFAVNYANGTQVSLGGGSYGDSNVTTLLGSFGSNSISTTGNITANNFSGNTNGYTLGYLDIPQIAASNTTLAATDGGKHYYSTTAGNLTLTIPNNATTSFATGTAISIVVQAAGNVLVNAASGVTLYMAGSSSAGNRVVGTYGMATLMKVASDTWFINGTGVY